MTFGQDPAPVSTTSELTPELAAEIFDKLKTASPTTVFTDPANDSKYDWDHVQAVVDEFKQMVKEFNEWASGKVITPEESHFDEETGEKVVDVEEVRYELTTETDLISKVNSDILDSKKVLNEIEPNGLWNEYKALFE
jgi:flagellar motor switch protein FliG